MHTHTLWYIHAHAKSHAINSTFPKAVLGEITWNSYKHLESSGLHFLDPSDLRSLMYHKEDHWISFHHRERLFLYFVTLAHDPNCLPSGLVFSHLISPLLPLRGFCCTPLTLFLNLTSSCLGKFKSL